MRKQRERRRCEGGLRAPGPVAGSVAAALLMGLFLALGGVVGGGAAMAQEAEPAAQAGSEPIFIKMEPFAVAVFGKRGVTSQVFVTVILDVVDSDAEEMVTERMPLLRDAFLKRLYALAGRPRTSGRGLNARLVKRRLLADSKRVLGAGVVRNILIQGMMEKRFPGASRR